MNHDYLHPTSHKIHTKTYGDFTFVYVTAPALPSSPRVRRVVFTVPDNAQPLHCRVVPKGACLVLNTTMLAPGARAAVEEFLAKDNATYARTSLRDWLRSRPVYAGRGAPFGVQTVVPDPDTPTFHVAVLDVNRYGYLPDGAYVGLRPRGTRIYVAFQDPVTGPRRVIASVDGTSRAHAVEALSSTLQEHGLVLARTGRG